MVFGNSGGSFRNAEFNAYKLANPPGKFLIYKDGSVAPNVQGNPNPAPLEYPSPFSYAEVQAHDIANPSDKWLLKDQNGNDIYYKAYTGDFFLDQGSVSYQAAALAKIRQALQFPNPNFDGLEFDNVWPNFYQPDGLSTTYAGSVSFPTGAGLICAKYPNNAAWEASVRSFIAAVGGQLKSEGYYVCPNAGHSTDIDGSLSLAWWVSIAPSVSAIENEYFEQISFGSTLRSTDHVNGHFWREWLDNLVGVQNLGIDFVGGCSGDTAADHYIPQYCRSSFLLKWDGTGRSNQYYIQSGSVDPYDLMWALDIGLPIGAMYKVGVGFRRHYTLGTVIVNPDPTASQLFTFENAYFRYNGQRVTSITLPPLRGEILEGVGTQPPPQLPDPFPFNDNTTGTGLNQFEYVGTWSTQNVGTCYQGQQHLSSQANSYYQFRFNGIQIAVMATKGPSFGIAAYSIDGGPETQVNANVGARVDQAVLFTSPVLPNGNHTLKVRVVSGGFTSADKVEVQPAGVVATSGFQPDDVFRRGEVHRYGYG